MDRVFVYGTLLPGRLRWPLVEEAVVEVIPTSTAGDLWDTGLGYPAATFPGRAAIHGAILRLDPQRATHVLALLDRVETGYRRRVVPTAAGVEALTYEWAGDTGSFSLLPAGRWDAAEER